MSMITSKDVKIGVMWGGKRRRERGVSLSKWLGGRREEERIKG